MKHYFINLPSWNPHFLFFCHLYLLVILRLKNNEGGSSLFLSLNMTSYLKTKDHTVDLAVSMVDTPFYTTPSVVGSNLTWVNPSYDPHRLV